MFDAGHGVCTLQVKLPKALFESALSSGNASLVERSVKAEASRPPPGKGWRAEAGQGQHDRPEPGTANRLRQLA